MCVGDIIQGIFGQSAANKQASATRDAANTAAQAQKYATDQQINYLTQGADAAETELRPYADLGAPALNLMKSAAGVTGDLTAANTAFNNSWEKQISDDAQTRAYQAALSTNAAAGKGGAFNSGKAMRAVQETGAQIDLANKNALYGKWGAMADTGMGAATAIGNARIGQGSGIAQAFGNQANALSANAWNKAAGITDAVQTGGLAVSNALGGINGYMSNAGNGFNWNSASKTVSNALGYRPSGRVTSQQGTIPKGGKI